MNITNDRFDRSRLVRRVAASAATAATLAATAALTCAPIAAADPERRCYSLTGGGYTCENAPTTTTTAPATSSYTGGGSSWSDRLPDLGFGFFLGLVLIVIGGIVWTANKPSGGAAHTPAAGVADASKRDERAIAAGMVGIGIIAMGWGVWGISGALLAAVIGVPVFLVAASASGKAEHEKAGYMLAQQQYAAEADRVRQIPVVRPNEYSDLGLSIPQQVQPFTPPPEPVISREEAYRLGRSNGFVVPAGSAAAVLLDPYGNDGPARAGLDRVAEQLGWGSWVTQGDQRVFTPYVALQGVSYSPDGDADVRLTVSHATVDESTIAKALPALLRTWNVRDGEVRREGGSVLVHATNKSLKQRLQENPQDSDAGEVWDF